MTRTKVCNSCSWSDLKGSFECTYIQQFNHHNMVQFHASMAQKTYDVLGLGDSKPA